MSKVLITARAQKGFFRCDLFFPKDGLILDLEDLDEKTRERLLSEPQLHVSEPTEADLARFAGDADSNAELRHQVAEAIRDLTIEDFQKDGKPKVDALKVLLPDAKIKAALRDEVFQTMVEDGFTAPAA